uniref:Uncharacterized protein n=1 Tax=viral metagenome TaxID=1070528 RepID=A0A6C0JU78_9ZZZZ
MDLSQRKLTRDEWNSIEKPVGSDELKIIQMISDGYTDLSIKRNNTKSILHYLKVSNSQDIDLFVFTKYLQPELIALTKYNLNYVKVSIPSRTIRKSDMIRFSNTDVQIQHVKPIIYEYVLLDVLKSMLKHKKRGNTEWSVYFYTLHCMMKFSVNECNRTFYSKLKDILATLLTDVDVKDILYRSTEIIEHNPYLLKYADDELYDHQKQLFTQFKSSNSLPQLVLYIAPTGTGKTLSPIGLSIGYKIIFVCAARHIGLALAKSAISHGVKVAFAFGCKHIEDIRLHYAAAVDYTKDRRSGSIRNVDNTNGTRVEIIISDLVSYIHAMHYMCKFHEKERIITYWDEPTISLDYDSHPCHELIQQNWRQNIIPNMVLSSATLPDEHELAPTIGDFKARFNQAEITTIISYDCKKTIPLINKEGYVVAPHILYSNYQDVLNCVTYCMRRKTMLRYIDLKSCTDFIQLIHETFPTSISHERYRYEFYFNNITDIHMINVKTYYLTLLSKLIPDTWPNIFKHLQMNRVPRFRSNVMVTTTDAHTLTDGPTIFLAEDVRKIGLFCLQRANIHSTVMDTIRKTISKNESINEKIKLLTKTLDDLLMKDVLLGNDQKLSDEARGSTEVKHLRKEIGTYIKSIQSIQLPSIYIPNTLEHLNIHAPKCQDKDKAYKSDIELTDIEQIMLIDDIEDMWKLLLMMGIGVFVTHKSERYTEIMKRLAYKQKLYLIIASTDFIYGTNYQFCHGYLASDLEGMSQEKTIQALGRIGRNKLQYDYTVRFRNDAILFKLFQDDEDKPEVANMTRIFNSPI